jgi:Fe-S cluster assembly protein SufD
MNDQSSSTFEGKIYVIPEAQKTEAYQLNNNLLLGSKSFAFSKPNLEIFADDVKASHGATVSNLSEEELFYFQARGISKKVASETLAKGFLDEIIKDASLCSTTQM